MATPDTWNPDYVGRYTIPVLTSLPVILIVGTLFGFLAGIGVGGGSLLVLWLTVVLQMDPSAARSINLIFFLPSALIACIFRLRQRTLEIRPLLPAILSGCIFAGIFSIISAMLDVLVLKKLFGIVLLITGLRELFYRPRKAR